MTGNWSEMGRRWESGKERDLKKKKKTVSDKLFIVKPKLRFWMCFTNQGQKLEGSHLFVASKKKVRLTETGGKWWGCGMGEVGGCW